MSDQHHDHHHHEEHHHHDSDWVFSKVVKAHNKVAQVLLKNAPNVVLSYEQRQNPPHEVALSNGEKGYLHIHDLLNVGDRLVAPVNQWAIVQAAVEPVLELSGPIEGLIAAALTLGEHHEPVMQLDGKLMVLPNDTSKEIAEALHLTVSATEAAFSPIVVYLHDHHHCDNPDHNHAHGDACGHDH